SRRGSAAPRRIRGRARARRPRRRGARSAEPRLPSARRAPPSICELVVSYRFSSFPGCRRSFLRKQEYERKPNVPIGRARRTGDVGLGTDLQVDRLDLPLAAGEVVADLVPQRLLRLLLAGDDEHGDLAIDVDLADVLFLELPGLRVAVQIRDRSGLHAVAEGQELLARHLRRLHRL